MDDNSDMEEDSKVVAKENKVDSRSEGESENSIIFTGERSDREEAKGMYVEDTDKEEMDRDSDVSTGSVVLNEDNKRTSKGITKRKRASEDDEGSDDELHNSKISSDKASIEDKNQKNVEIFRIINSAEEIERLRRKSGNLQGKVSGEMKRLIILIKNAANSLRNQEKNVLLPEEDKNNEIIRLKGDIEQLKLRVEEQKAMINDLKNRKETPRVRGITRVPAEEESQINAMVNKVREQRNNIDKLRNNVPVTGQIDVQKITENS